MKEGAGEDEGIVTRSEEDRESRSDGFRGENQDV